MGFSGKSIFVSLILATILVLHYEPAIAYKLITHFGSNIHWDIQDIPVTYSINKANFEDCEINDIHQAFQTWGVINDAYLKFQFNGFTPQSRGLDDTPPDATHLIVKLTNLPPDVGFSAETRFDTAYIDLNGRIRDADIIFNGDISWNCSAWPDIIWLWEYDMQSIALHEIGHFIGIDHPFGSKYPDAGKRTSVVEPIPPGEKWRELFPDDVNAVRFLYGAQLDLIFTIDVTGSMWDDIAQVKTSASAIVDEISTKVSDWRIAIVDFQDFPVHPYGCAPNELWSGYPGDWPYRAVLPFSTDKAAITNAINSLTPLCGWDWPESYYSALIRSINTEGLGAWRDGVKKVIILMGDAPPHDPEPFTGYTLSDVVTAAQAVDPAVVYPIFIGGDSTAYAYFSSLAEETGGQVIPAASASQVVNAILTAIEKALQSPSAEAGGPYTGNVGVPIIMDASGSSDPDGSIVLYEWDWDNDGTYDESTALPILNHTWTMAFIGTVRLRVTDNNGLTGIDIASIEITAVLNQPPIANAGPDQTLECTNPNETPVTLDGSASSDPGGDTLSFSWSGPFGTTGGVNPTVLLSAGKSTINLVVNDGQVDSLPDTVNITVQDTTAPNLQVPPDIIDECTSPTGEAVNLGTATASDACSTNVGISNNAPVLFALGTTPVSWAATDEYGNASRGIQSVKIVDTTPPEISLNCSPGILWPPNHNMVEITPIITTGDVCDPSVNVTLSQITMNEGDATNTYDPNYDVTTGDGHTIADIQVSSDGRIYLRAERSGNNLGGRKYTITYKATDDSGNSSTASCEILVPHDVR